MMFHHTRTPDPTWQQRLNALFPPTGQVPWLKVVWEPGDEWAPVQRWEIRQMYPMLDILPHWLTEAYADEHPRKLGRWLKDDHNNLYWETTAVVSRAQWELFQHTKCHSTRFWIVQGELGGHLFQLRDEDQRFLKALGSSVTDTPAPGELPYAEPSERTFQRIAEFDKMREWAGAWDARTSKTAAGLIVTAEALDRDQEMGKRMLAMLDEQVYGAVDGLRQSSLNEYYDSIPAIDIEEENPEVVEERLMTSLSTPLPD